MHRSGAAGCLLAAALALTAPAAATAKPAVDQAIATKARPKVELRSVSSPSRTAVLAGTNVTVSGRLTNATGRAARPRITFTLRATKGATPKTLTAKTLSRVSAGRTASYRVTAKVPSRLASGAYYLRACVRIGKGQSDCRYATRKLRVSARPKPPVSPAPVNPPSVTTPLPAPGPENSPRFDVLVFTKTVGEYKPSTEDAVKALEELGRANRFRVTATEDASAFTESNLKRYRTVVFLNTAGDVLSNAQQAAFLSYYTEGGGFLAVNAAIQTEPGWQFMSDLLGARAAGAQSPLGRATIKVVDRGHAASKPLPEYWRHVDRYFNFTANVRGFAHVLATVDESTYSGGTMGADHPIAWCKDYKGGRSFYTGVGDTPGGFAEEGVRAHLLGAIQWAAGLADPVYSDCGATVLANYQQTKVSAPPNLNEPIGFDVLPDGRVLQTARGGQLRLHDPKAAKEIVLATLPVYTHSEDGLYGPAIDNDFATNKWVYLYYAPQTVTNVKQSDGTTKTITTPSTDAPDKAASLSAWDPYVGYFQLSRFKFVDGPNPSLDLASEQKIMRVSNDRGACCHVAGDIDFDSHNNLWLVTGDDTPSGGGNSGGFSPHNDQMTEDGLYNAPFVDARRSALNTNDLRGKVLRIHVNADGSYTSPSGNLFPAGTAKTRPEIYAMGFRNPFRIQVDENDVAYVTDYSPDAAVPETFRGPAGTGRVEIVRKPSNYGWPLCMSPELPYYRWNFNTSKPLDSPARPHDCANPSRGPQNSSRWNLNGSPTVEAGLEYAPPITQPDIWYSYRDNTPGAPLGTPCLASYDGSGGTCPQLFPELYTGGVGPHGAAKYHYAAANPNPTKLPPYYDDAIFLAEFTQDTLREVRLDANKQIFKINNLLDCGDFSAARDTKPFECDSPMDLQFGADGALYLLTYGDGFFTQNPDAGMYRFDYVKGQRAPQAVLNATPTNGQAPLSVRFSSEGTRDPDPSDSIEYAWDFDGDGSVDSIDPNPTHVYATNGVFTAKLTVTDSGGKTDTKTTVITIGNTAPVITITAPVEGGFFDWGQKIAYQVTVTDAEDGAGDCPKVDVTFVLLHDTHGHGEQNQTGCSGTLQTRAEDASHGGQLAGGISVTYTDNGANGQPALTTTTQTVIQVKRHEAELMTEHSGTSTATSYFGAPSYASSLDPGDWLAVNRAVNLTNMTGVTVNLAACGTTAGAPAGALELRLDSATGPLLTTFDIKVNDTFQYCSIIPTFQTLTANITAPGGGHKLYLVPKAAAGGSTSDLFLIDWVQFNGAGIGS